MMHIYDLISIHVCIFFPVRDWNQYSFHCMYKDNNLLAVEIPKCTTPYCPSNSPGHTYMGLDLSPIGGGIAFPLRHGL